MMFTSINRTIFDIPLTWDRTRFESSRIKCRQARKLIEMSINAQYNKHLKETFFQKLDIEKDIHECQERVNTQERKIRALDNLTDVAAQSLDHYFDKRMENVRNAIQDHCNAIQQILREENEHWQEIHTAIDQNLITSKDIHPPAVVSEDIPTTANIHTIDEVDEEEHTSKLLNNKTVTPLLTQMIRKSRLQSNRCSIIESNDVSSTTEHIIQSKQERFSVLIPLTSTRRTLQVIDTTFVVKLEATKTNESNKSYPDEVIPIESLPTTDVEPTPSYSQPKLPARLYFSPTLLQDDNDESQPIQPVLSTIDQNQINIEKPRTIPRRFGQTFLLDNIKTEEINESQNTENIRPKISDEIAFMINCDPTLPLEKQTFNESSHHSEIIEQPKSIIYGKRRTRNVPITATTKTEWEPVHMTRRVTRKQKPIKETETDKRSTRKRKQSATDDGNNNTVALRKKKAVAPATETKTKPRKTRGRKPKEMPVREPSPLPIIDRSKHYSTRFSTRSHRFNNLTLSATTMTDDDKDDDNDNNNNNKSKYSSTRLRGKSIGRPRKYHDDDTEQNSSTKRSKENKNQSKQRAKSTIVTRNRKK